MTTVLFDMDGTLTDPRKEIKDDMINLLAKITEFASIGIVTGSPINYVIDQLSRGFSSWDKSVLSKITLYPCNGTQIYRYSSLSSEFCVEYKKTFKDFLDTVGDSSNLYMHLIINLLNLQSYALKKYSDLEVAGHFISFRESMINWSMPGREADDALRQFFVEIDQREGIRKHLAEVFRKRLDLLGMNKVDMALGGSTSIDIFPKGWDKTYVLRHISDEDIWFYGDRCQPGGNDFHLYSHPDVRKRSFEVRGPEDMMIRGLGLLSELKTFNE